MKFMSIILSVLVATNFVACSKKKGGGSPQPYYNNYGQYPYGQTPYGQGPYGQQVGVNPQQQYQQQTNPGFNGQLKSCQSPMSTSLIQYCGWLATEAEETAGCDHDEVRQVFMQYCSQYATQMNFCVPQVQQTACYGCSPIYESDDEIYSDDGASSGDVVTSQPAPTYRVKPNAPPPASVAQKPSQPAAQPVVKSCEINIQKCRLIRADTQRKLSRDILPGAHLEKNLKNNNVECLVTGSNRYQNYFELLKSCESQKSEPVITPIQEQPPVIAENIPEKQNQPSIVEESQVAVPQAKPQDAVVKPKVAGGTCFNLQEIHDMLADSKNGYSSYSRKYIQALDVGNRKLTPQFTKMITERIYNQENGSVHLDTPNTQNGSAIATQVEQSGLSIGDRIVIGNEEGSISRCLNNNLLEAKFIDPDGVIRYTIFTWNGLLSDEGNINVTTTAVLKSGSEVARYETTRLVIWGKNISEKDLQKKAKQELQEFESVRAEAKKRNQTLDLIKK